MPYRETFRVLHLSQATQSPAQGKDSTSGVLAQEMARHTLVVSGTRLLPEECARLGEQPPDLAQGQERKHSLEGRTYPNLQYRARALLRRLVLHL